MDTIDFLLELAKEVDCKTDNDLIFSDEVHFMGSKIGGWVRVGDGLIKVHLPRIGKHVEFQLCDPLCFQRLNVLFNGS